MNSLIALQLLISGLSTGCIYSLVALALVIPFKASGILNFGQGELVTVGAYFALVATSSGLPYPLVFVSVLIVGAFAGIVFEQIFIRPIIKAPEFTIVIATFAIGLCLKSAIRLIFEDNTHSIDGPFAESGFLRNYRINPDSAWIIGCAIVVTIGVSIFFKRARLGKAMRAVSSNQEAATLMGITVGGVYRASWMLSTLIAALTGLLIAPVVGVNPEIGNLLLKALIAAVIGGFSSLGGALLGGIVIGLAEAYAGVFISSSFKNLMPFVILMTVLIFKPNGLFGASEARRV